MYDYLHITYYHYQTKTFKQLSHFSSADLTESGSRVRYFARLFLKNRAPPTYLASTFYHIFIWTLWSQNNIRVPNVKIISVIIRYSLGQKTFVPHTYRLILLKNSLNKQKCKYQRINYTSVYCNPKKVKSRDWFRKPGKSVINCA